MEQKVKKVEYKVKVVNGMIQYSNLQSCHAIWQRVSRHLFDRKETVEKKIKLMHLSILGLFSHSQKEKGKKKKLNKN